MKTLKTFLKKHGAYEDDFDEDGLKFTKNLTLKDFLNTCPRGSWILWLFERTNRNSLRELTLVKGHCANTVRQLMKDERSTRAVDVAIAFGEGKATKEELDDAAAAADAARTACDAAYTTWTACAAAQSAHAAALAAVAAYNAAAAVGDAATWIACSASRAAQAAAQAAVVAAADYNARPAWVDGWAALKQNQKQTADICRKFLPIEIWNQSQF